jgi:hypothetical protein
LVPKDNGGGDILLRVLADLKGRNESSTARTHERVTQPGRYGRLKAENIRGEGTEG